MPSQAVNRPTLGIHQVVRTSGAMYSTVPTGEMADSCRMLMVSPKSPCAHHPGSIAERRLLSFLCVRRPQQGISEAGSSRPQTKQASRQGMPVPHSIACSEVCSSGGSRQQAARTAGWCLTSFTLPWSSMKMFSSLMSLQQVKEQAVGLGQLGATSQHASCRPLPGCWHLPLPAAACCCLLLLLRAASRPPTCV